MSGRTVFVTGSARGIGYGIAKAFAENGDRVALNARTDEAALTTAVAALTESTTSTETALPESTTSTETALARSMPPTETALAESTPSTVTGFLADLSDYGNTLDCAARINARFGPVEVLINNAGMAHFGLFTDMTPSQWEAVLRHNLYTTINTCRTFAPAMVRAKSGVIINISSVWGITGASCEAIYAAAKGAVNAFTKSLAKELGPSGVRVNAIACGAFETRMNERLSSEEKQAFIENIPLSRFGEPDEAGRLAVFLASEEARYLTGQVLTLDGGLI